MLTQQTVTHLRTLRLDGMARAFEEQLTQPVATGLAFGRLAGALNWVKRHSVALTATSAVALGFFGVLLTLNRFVWLTQRLQSGLTHVGLGRLLTLG